MYPNLLAQNGCFVKVWQSLCFHVGTSTSTLIPFLKGPRADQLSIAHTTKKNSKNELSASHDINVPDPSKRLTIEGLFECNPPNKGNCAPGLVRSVLGRVGASAFPSRFRARNLAVSDTAMTLMFPIPPKDSPLKDCSSAIPQTRKSRTHLFRSVFGRVGFCLLPHLRAHALVVSDTACVRPSLTTHQRGLPLCKGALHANTLSRSLQRAHTLFRAPSCGIPFPLCTHRGGGAINLDNQLSTFFSERFQKGASLQRAHTLFWAPSGGAQCPLCGWGTHTHTQGGAQSILTINFQHPFLKGF